MVDENSFSNNNFISQEESNQKFYENSQETYNEGGQIKNQLEQAEQIIIQQQNVFKEQQIQIEQVGNINKFQLVIVKIENYLQKVSRIIAKSEIINKMHGFSSIISANQMQKVRLEYKTQLVHNMINQKINKLSRIFNKGVLKRKRKVLGQIMSYLYDNSIQDVIEKSLEDKQKQFQTILNQKTQEVNQLKKKYDDQQQQYQCHINENQFNSPSNKKHNINNNEMNMQSLQQKLNILEQENVEIMERKILMENNLEVFIGDITGFLDEQENQLEKSQQHQQKFLQQEQNKYKKNQPLVSPKTNESYSK